MTVGNRFHGQIEANTTFYLVEWWRTRPKPRGAIVCGEAGFRLKGTADSLVGIDIAVASAELVAAMDPEERIYNGPPILAVEILSPSDTHDDLVDAVKSYLEVGTVVWIIDPDFETVAVHQPGQQPQTLNVREVLDGEPYLPGFRVAVAQLFEWD
jgi:Uma2 family endonuclease